MEGISVPPRGTPGPAPVSGRTRAGQAGILWCGAGVQLGQCCSLSALISGPEAGSSLPAALRAPAAETPLASARCRDSGCLRASPFPELPLGQQVGRGAVNAHLHTKNKPTLVALEVLGLVPSLCMCLALLMGHKWDSPACLSINCRALGRGPFV